MALPAKRRRVSGTASLTSNYISSENSTSTPANSYTGQFVYAVQYGSIKSSLSADEPGTIYFEFSEDGTNVRETVSDTTTAGVGYFRTVLIENLYVRIRWVASAATPTTFVLYTVLAKTSTGVSTATGTVTSVGTGTGLTGGPITTTGTISLANTTVVPASYSLATVVVDAQGRITSAANGSFPVQTHKMVFNCHFGSSSGSTGAGNYLPLNGYNNSGGFASSTITEMQNIMPCPGTFSRLYASMLSGTSTAGNTRTIYLSVNGVDQALATGLLNPTYTSSDTVNTVSVAAGDLVCFHMVDTPGSFIASSRQFSIAVQFNPL